MHPNGTSSPRRRPAAAITAAAALLAGAGLGTLAPAAPASADGPLTFTNSAEITINDPDDDGQVAVSSPYPSSIAVSDMAGRVQDVSVTLRSLTHPFVADLDVLLVAPGGESLVLLSDAGGSDLQAPDTDLTFADDGGTFPDWPELPSGTYQPIAEGTDPDVYPDPAPTPGTSSTFEDAFSDIDPNGTWNLYVVDDARGGSGVISDGWSLTITTRETAAATTTTFTIDPNPAVNGEDDVTLTAVVTSGGEPVTEGTVTFSGPQASYGESALDGQGQAAMTFPAMEAIEDETQTWTATYNGTDSYTTSSATADLVINDRTVVSGNQYCNPGRASIAQVGTARGYPLQVFVEDREGATVTDARVHLRGLEHPFAGDLDIMLVSPDGDSLVVLSDVPGTLPSPTTVVIADDGDEAATLPGAGTVLPTNVDDGGSDFFPAPAPAPSAADSFADSIVGGAAQGTWSLYIVDDASGSSGALTEGWCLELTTQASTTLALDAPSTVAAGEDVQVTATVTSGDDPVGVGTVSYSVDGSAPVEVGAPDANGQVTFTLADIALGVHTITATYSGNDDFADSTAGPVQVTAASSTVTTITADPATPVAHQPVEISVAVTADGTAVAEGSVELSINGDATTIDAADLATTPISYTPTSTDPIDITASYSGTETLAASEDQTTLTPQAIPTELVLTAPATAVDGDEVTLVAEVSSTGAALLPTGSVTFSDGAEVLGTVPLTAGSAQLTTVVAAGVHDLTAIFTSDSGFGTSQAQASLEVTPIAAAGGPYTVAEGAALTLPASGSSTGATIGWDLDADGDFTDATGAEPTLTWAQLETLGIDDGPSDHAVTMRIAVDGLVAEDTATLQVTNTAPEVIIDGPATAVVGEELTLKLSADDPSSADLAADFTYIVDWGDGSPVEQVVGPADPPVSHTYTEAGDVQATFSVVDRDGDGGGEQTLTITVAAAEEEGPTPTPPPTEEPTGAGDEAPTDGPRTGDNGSTTATVGLPSTGFSPLGAGAAALFLLTGGLVLLVRRWAAHY